jgi:hyperosmotically inducible protein
MSNHFPFPKLVHLFGAGALIAASLISVSAYAQSTQKTLQQRRADVEVQLQKEVRHVLVMQPFYSVFDNLEFKVEGDRVTLMGQVVNPALKAGAAASVKAIEGVTAVDNQIEVLPPSRDDNRIRRRIFHAIYSATGMEKYAIQAVPPIHIIVKLGRATLVGVVDSAADKTLAGIRANQVPGVFSVTNNLRVKK